ncbi:thioredoxin domain-containing protein [Staphylococcus edaphicus]|uniref:DsbA family protein n=1 Tax=Staphylococcus edaphicus TaxID=1955013 RepID=A0A2C6WKP2_9STAP|nr:thioredoxin domain-containing protein [Staphylococcus edaphicus]PHK48939.1 hypothetical protein BTJ66_10835 [Staphylococcus edaphicus]UQW81973.1 DsbA family protein [Staphylococcus edaphicus]
MTIVKHLSFGSVNAPIKVESFINFACPYCKNYFKAVDNTLTPYIEAGQVQHIIKHFDKTKQALLKGTVANIHLDYDKPEETLAIIRKLYETQENWKASFTDIEEKMAHEFNLTPKKDADARSLAINEEIFDRGIKGIPTVFINEEQFQFNPLEDEQVKIETLLKETISKLT